MESQPYNAYHQPVYIVSWNEEDIDWISKGEIPAALDIVTDSVHLLTFLSKTIVAHNNLIDSCISSALLTLYNLREQYWKIDPAAENLSDVYFSSEDLSVSYSSADKLHERRSRVLGHSRDCARQ